MTRLVGLSLVLLMPVAPAPAPGLAQAWTPDAPAALQAWSPDAPAALQMHCPLGFGRSGATVIGAGAVDKIESELIDTANGFAYLGTDTFPGKILKVSLITFTAVATLTLNSGEDRLATAVIDSAGGYAYFGTHTIPGRVVKIDLATFTRVGAITMNSDEGNLASAVYDATNGFAYFGTQGSTPERVIKVDVSQSNFARIGSVPLLAGEDELTSAAIDEAAGYAYFGTQTIPARVVKVDVNDPTFARVGSVTLDPGEDWAWAMVIDPAKGFAYVGTGSFPGHVVKLDLSAVPFSRVDAIPLQPGEDRISSGVIDTDKRYAYFATILPAPGVVVQIDLDNFSRTGTAVLDADERYLTEMLLDPTTGHGYVATYDELASGDVELVRLCLPHRTPSVPLYNLLPEAPASPPTAPCVEVPHTGGIDILRDDPCAGQMPEGPYGGLLGDTAFQYGSGVGVYPHSGELYVTEVDLEVPSRGFDWKLERKYRSGLSYNGSLGRNWFANYGERRLVRVTADNLAAVDPGTSVPITVGDVLLLDGLGRVDVYADNGSGGFDEPAGHFSKLVENPDGSFSERDAWGNRVDYGVPDDFENARMTALADRHGNTMQFEYDASDRLIRVKDTLGRHIDYHYDGFGRIDYVQDFIGRRVSYAYSADGDLVSVTSPPITGTVTSNDFPVGKTVRYGYTAGISNPLLAHNLISITAPSEVALDPDGPPRVVAAYDAEDRVTTFTVGGTNATTVPAGGTRTFTYTAFPDTDPMNLNLPLAETEVFDSAGNRSVYQFNRLGNIVTSRAYTNRDVRPVDPTFYETTYLYNADSKLTRINYPEGNRADYTYDSANSDPLQQGNLLTAVRVADMDRGGDQTAITTTFTYEPIYNQLRRVTDPRGNDPAFSPPNGGANSAARYRWQSTFDYEEACNFAAIGAPRGLNAGQAQALLVAAGMCAAPLGDVNGDGTTLSAFGDLVRRAAPTVTLLGGSNMAAIEGGTAQPIAVLYAFNPFGQLTARRDPEGNVTAYRYYHENDPDGDGLNLTTGVGSGPYGYLAGQIVDTGRVGDCNADGAVDAGDLSALSLEAFDADGTAWHAVGGSTFAGNPNGCDPNGDTKVDAADFSCEVLRIFLGPSACGTGSLVPSASRDSGTNPTLVEAMTAYSYDRVGNVTRTVDGRGIATDLAVNAANQVVQVTRASAHGIFAPRPTEPVTLTAFAYRERYHYDANDNLVKVHTEDRGNTSAVGADNAGSGTAFVDRDYQYDILDRRIRASEEVSDTLDLVTRYRYDANGNPVLVILPVGNAVGSLYDERDLPFRATRGITSPPASALLAAGDPTNYNVRGGAPSAATYRFDGNGGLVEACDGADTDGSPANNCTMAGGGDRTRYLYDGFDRLTSAVDAVGSQEVYQYDPASNLVRQAAFGPVGGPSPTSDGPNPLLQPVSSGGAIVPASLVTTTLLAAAEARHDEMGRDYEVGQALFVNTIATGRPPDVADGAADGGKGDLTPADTCAVPGLVAPPGGWQGCVTTRSEYDRNGRPTFTVEDDLDTSRVFYDGANRQTKAQDGAGNLAEIAYDDNDNKIETRLTDKSSGVTLTDEVFLTTWFYDSLDRAQRRVDNLGQATDLRYDSRDNLVARANAEGPLTGAMIARRAFSGGLLTVNAINDYGNVTRYAYDGLSRLVREDMVLTASGAGNGTHIGADLFGVPAALPPADPAQGGGDGLVTKRYAWEGNDLALHLTDDNGNRTLADYDNLDRQITETHGICVPPLLADRCDPPTSTAQYVDPDDNLTIWTDELASVTTLVHDAANRRTSLSIARAVSVTGTTTMTYAYDGLGRIVGATDNNEPATSSDDSALAQAYDSLGRRIEEAQTLGGGPTRLVGTAWRAEDLRTGLTYPNDRRVNYAYDALDRLVDLRDTAAPLAIASYSWIGQGRVAERRHPQNGTRLTFLNDAGTADIGYDGLRQPVQLRHLRSDNSLVAGLTHGFDRTQDPLGEGKLHNPVNLQAYTYDSADRLVQFSRPAGGSMPPLHGSFTLDGAGNWKQVDGETRQHSSFNEVITVTTGITVAVLSDDNGNLTDDGARLYSYDARNRLRGVASKATGLPIAAYTYDALGRRIRKVVTNSGGLNGTTDVTWDDWREVEQRDGAGTLVDQTVFGWQLDEPVVLDRNTGGGSTTTGPGDQRLTYHAGDRQSIFALTNITGTVVEGYQYDAYGRPVVYTPGPNGMVDWGGDDGIAPAGASAVGNPFLFTGRRWDPETGLYHYRTRHLHPTLGRFTSRDLIGFWGDPGNLGNAYAYVGGRPVRFVDPMGLIGVTKSRSNIGVHSAGDPVPGCDVYLEQNPGGIMAQAVGAGQGGGGADWAMTGYIKGPGNIKKHSAGDPVPGCDVYLEQNPGGITAQAVGAGQGGGGAEPGDVGAMGGLVKGLSNIKQQSVSGQPVRGPVWAMAGFIKGLSNIKSQSVGGQPVQGPVWAMAGQGIPQLAVGILKPPGTQPQSVVGVSPVCPGPPGRGGGVGPEVGAGVHLP